MPIVNLLAQAATFCTAEGTSLATLPPSGQVAFCQTHSTERRPTVGIFEASIPVTAYAPPVRVDGLPDDQSLDILVPAVVADAMRLLGLRRFGAVFSPAPLIYREGRAVGTPGLILHEDLRREPRTHCIAAK